MSSGACDPSPWGMEPETVGGGRSRKPHRELERGPQGSFFRGASLPTPPTPPPPAPVTSGHVLDCVPIGEVG